MSFVKVLDEGYVRLVDHMGSDLTVVNAARVSYAKESLVLSDRDIKLIKFLAREGHTSPFRHAVAQFEVYAPLIDQSNRGCGVQSAEVPAYCSLRRFGLRSTR